MEILIWTVSYIFLKFTISFAHQIFESVVCVEHYSRPVNKTAPNLSPYRVLHVKRVQRIKALYISNAEWLSKGKSVGVHQQEKKVLFSQQTFPMSLTSCHKGSYFPCFLSSPSVFWFPLQFFFLPSGVGGTAYISCLGLFQNICSGI